MPSFGTINLQKVLDPAARVPVSTTLVDFDMMIGAVHDRR